MIIVFIVLQLMALLIIGLMLANTRKEGKKLKKDRIISTKKIAPKGHKK